MSAVIHPPRWGRAYKLGIDVLDNEHEEIIALLNRLYQEWEQDFPSPVLLATYKEIVQEVAHHFQDEEAFMTSRRYPQRDQHKAEHDAFFEQLMAVQHDLEAGSATVNAALLGYAADWLRNHLIVSDKRLIPYA